MSSEASSQSSELDVPKKLPSSPTTESSLAEEDGETSSEAQQSDEPELQPEPPDVPEPFQGTDNPPATDTIRLVFAYGYTDSKELTLDDNAAVSKVVEIVRSFSASDYSGSGMLGGDMVQIFFTQDGIEYRYSVLSMKHNDNQLIESGREPGVYYETTPENFQYLMDCFDGIPQ